MNYGLYRTYLYPKLSSCTRYLLTSQISGYKEVLYFFSNHHWNVLCVHFTNNDGAVSLFNILVNSTLRIYVLQHL